MADILKPELLWIEGRCYRINNPISDISSFQEHDLYENEETDIPFDMEGFDEDGVECSLIENGRYSTSIHVPKPYIGLVIGKKGATRIMIERETKTDLKIPRQGQPGDVVIYGYTPSHCKAARRKINSIVISARAKYRPTHFISLPMNNHEIKNNFHKFKESVLAECTDRGIEESLFIEPEKLHLTFCVMVLLDNVEREFATQLFTDSKETVIVPTLEGELPLRIQLRGLSYMNDDPADCNVLYGLVEEVDPKTGALQTLADSLLEYFSKRGYRGRDFGVEHVKLHVTLMNTRYRKVPGSDDRDTQRKSFDATRVLEKFGDYYFGVMEVSEIHLSQCHTVGPDGYYQSSCVIPLKP